MTQDAERLARLAADNSAYHQAAIAMRREINRLKREVERLEAALAVVAEPCDCCYAGT